MNEAVLDILYTASTWILPIVLAVTLHEAAHAYVAWLRGDNTAKDLGRVSLNPLVHIDRFGTVVLPALLFLLRAPFIFGWAKPVPVDFRNLNNPRRDMIWVAAAGPAANIVLALSAALLAHVANLWPQSAASDWLFDNFRHAILINVVLAVFNMLPVPPLDGGRIAVGLLPRVLAEPLARLERFGILIILSLLFLPPLIGNMLRVDLDLFPLLIGIPVEWIFGMILWLTGWAA